MVLNPEVISNASHIIRVGEINLPFGQDRKDSGQMILSAVSATDYDGRQLWIPVLCSSENQLESILEQTGKNADRCQMAGNLTEGQKQEVRTLVTDYKMPWPLAIYISLNGLDDFDWQACQKPEPEVEPPAMLTISGKPGTGKSSALAVAAKLETTDVNVWAVNADPWAREGTTVTNYIDVVDVMSVEETEAAVTATRDGSERRDRPSRTVREIMGGMSKILLSRVDRPDVIAMDLSGHDETRADDIVDLMAYFCFEPIVDMNHGGKAELRVKTIEALRYLKDYKGRLDANVVSSLN